MEHSNSTQPEVTPLPPGLLTDDGYGVWQMTNGVATVAVSSLGLITNVINIKTFVAMGLEDGVTVSFLGLATSDLTMSILNFCNGISLILHALEFMNRSHLFPLDPMWGVVFFTNLGTAVFIITVLNTVYLAVARCMCVARPLQFKNSFTRTRSLVLLILFTLFAIVLYVPIFVHTGITNVFSPQLNGTRYVIWLSPEREKFKDGVLLISLTIVPFSSQFIVTVCVFVLTWNLLKATRFRREHSSEGILDLDEKDGHKGGLSTKDLIVVKQVVLISTIFIVLNLPMIMLGLAGMLLPGFDANWATHRYARIYYTAHCLRRVLEQINSSVNIFIYYHYNSTFRKLYKVC